MAASKIEERILAQQINTEELRVKREELQQLQETKHQKSARIEALDTENLELIKQIPYQVRKCVLTPLSQSDLNVKDCTSIES